MLATQSDSKRSAVPLCWFLEGTACFRARVTVIAAMALARCTPGAFKACKAPKLRVRRCVNWLRLPHPLDAGFGTRARLLAGCRVSQNVARCAAKAENAEKADKSAAAEKEASSSKEESPFPPREPPAAQASASASSSSQVRQLGHQICPLGTFRSRPLQ